MTPFCTACYLLWNPGNKPFSSVEVVCPPSWVKFGHSCYNFETVVQKLTLEESREHCKKRGKDATSWQSKLTGSIPFWKLIRFLCTDISCSSCLFKGFGFINSSLKLPQSKTCRVRLVTSRYECELRRWVVSLSCLVTCPRCSPTLA